MIEDNRDFDKEFEEYLQREDNRLKALMKLADIIKNSNSPNLIKKENTDIITLKTKKYSN